MQANYSVGKDGRNYGRVGIRATVCRLLYDTILLVLWRLWGGLILCLCVIRALVSLEEKMIQGETFNSQRLRTVCFECCGELLLLLLTCHGGTSSYE